MPKILLLFSFTFLMLVTLSQPITIQGTVIDKKTKAALQGASVRLDKYNGTITNSKGYFALTGEMEALKTKGLTVSFIGYQSRTIYFETAINHTITLEPKGNNLDELVVSTRGKTIIEKALDKVPVNYPVKPFKITGLHRVYNTINDSDYFYKSDGIVEAYYSSFLEDPLTVETKLVHNTIDFAEKKNSKYYNDPVKPKWVGEFYHMPDLASLVNGLYFNRKALNDFYFFDKGKTWFEDRKVFMVAFETKKKQQHEGVFYIDTATYAFAGMDLTSYNIKEPFFVTVALRKANVTCQPINGKWYIKNSHSESKHVMNYNSNYTRDFDFIKLDTTDIEPLKYQEKMQRHDENIQTLKHGSINDSLLLDSIVKQAEAANTIRQFIKPTLDTSLPVVVKKKSLKASWINYLRGDNIRLGIPLSKLPFNTAQSSHAYTTEYAIGIQTDYRLFRSFFLQVASQFNFGISGIFISTNQFSLVHEIIINKKHRPITLRPYTGYSLITLKIQNRDDEIRISNWQSGVSIAIEQTRKRSWFICSNYNHIQNKTALQDIGISLERFSFGAGFIFKR